MLLSLTSESSSLSSVTSWGRAPASSTLYLPFVITAILEGGRKGERRGGGKGRREEEGEEGEDGGGRSKVASK